jgi:hypothetical protein
LKQVNIYLIQRHLPKGAAGPLACSVHDPAGWLGKAHARNKVTVNKSPGKRFVHHQNKL